MHFSELPKHYADKSLYQTALSKDPFEQMYQWLAEAKATGISELNAMALATATPDGKPSCRTVLLKEFDQKGLIFFTNYDSRKAKELLENPFAMATLYWKEVMRQICVEGTAEKISREESETYFATRPRGSQFGAWTSHQDRVIPSRIHLENKLEEVKQRFDNQKVPCPPFWGGFRLIPHRFEFWQGGKDRLHDRFEYVLEGNQWNIDRLSP